MVIIQSATTSTAASLLDLKRRGFSSVELHLLSDPEESDFETWLDSGLECYTVHTPLYPKDTTRHNNDLCLEDIIENRAFAILRETAKLASRVATLMKHKVFVIMHNTETVTYFKRNLELYVSVLALLSDLYPDVFYCVENVTPISSKGEFRNGLYLDDIHDICVALNEKLGENRVGICFDICHFLSTVQFVNDAMVKSVNKDLLAVLHDKKLDLKYNISSCDDLLWNIHVAVTSGIGDYKDTHAICLSARDKHMLGDLRDYIELSRSSPIWTMEVNEIDYDCRVNAGKSLSILKDVLGV